MNRGSPWNLWSIVLADGDICTMPLSIFQQLVKHPLNDLDMKKFLAAWKPQLQK